MVGADVTVVAGFGFARLFQAELMAQMAAGALADGAVCGRFADVMAAFAGEPGNGLALKLVEGVAGALQRPWCAASGSGACAQADAHPRGA